MMAQAGLLEKWRHQYQPKGPCLKASQKRAAENQKSNNSKNKSTLSRLSLKNLSGAFVILVFGITFSVTFFIGEIIINRYRNRSIRRNVVVNNRITPIAPKVLEIINDEASPIAEGKKTAVASAITEVKIKDDKSQIQIVKKTVKNKTNNPI